jgi:hypothetical protein
MPLRLWGSIQSLQEFQPVHLLFKPRKFIFRPAELFSGTCGCGERAVTKARGFGKDGLEIAYRRHSWSPQPDSHMLR